MSFSAIRLFGPSRQALTSSKVKALTDTDVHVSSNSWGVLDNTIEYATPEITEALRYGVTNVNDFTIGVKKCTKHI